MIYNRSLSYKVRDDEAAVKVVKDAAGICLVIFFIIGVFFNSLAIHTFRLSRILHTPCNFLAVGHILCDLLVLLFCVPFEIASHFYGAWLFGIEWCHGYGFVVTLLWVTSVCIYTAMAFERCLVVTHTTFAKKITMFKACMTILSCFGYGLMWAAFPLVGWGNYRIDAAGTSCGLEWDDDADSQYSYGVTLIVLVLIFPVSAKAFCYIKFMIQVSTNSVTPRSTDLAVTLQIQTARSKEIQVAYAAFIAILAFVLGMTPYWITAIWSMFNDMSDLNAMVAIAAPIFMQSTCVSGPIIYVMRNRDFREALKDTLMKRWLPEAPGNTEA